MIFALAGLASTLVVLPLCFGFRPGRAAFAEFRESWAVVLFVLVATLLTEAMDAYLSRNGKLWLAYRYPQYHAKGLLLSMGDNFALYTELLAFVPAVWMVCRTRNAGGDAQAHDVDVAEARKRSVTFFAFLIGFYITEDLVPAATIFRHEPLAASG